MMMTRLVPVIAVAAATLTASPVASAQTPRDQRSLRAIHQAHNECNSWACVRRVRRAHNLRLIRARHNECRTWACVRRVRRARARRAANTYGSVVAPYRSWLASTRACESGGNYAISTGNGFYGAYQFTLSSWAAVGGSGYPHLASPAEQDYRAVLLLHLQGRGAWPVCG